ncbi:double-strand break repair helicase AddA [Caulobacter sp. KR2-114]|uniref:double-strand break repair helicase AddA n=1 Tax=Caulobacter sp. KR2-114 TaxID=3400912 RepID=UPI003C1206C0
MSDPRLPFTMWDPQVQASDPKATVFVAANAGAGKTSTLVKRVARLLLAGAAPGAILCVTYTKAGAAEMQRRLFQQLGDWAVMRDDALRATLQELDEGHRDLSAARALFARALETPGGLKIQTIHAFCEKLLRRFPLEAGVSPGFQVLEDAAAAQLSAEAREAAARQAMGHPDAAIATAYNHFAVELDYRSFNAMFAIFEARRRSIAGYIDACGGPTLAERDIWRRCGFARPTEPEAITAAALERIRWGQWRRAAEALAATGKTSDAQAAERMRKVEAEPTFEGLGGVFLNQQGQPRARVGTQGLEPWATEWLAEEQARLVEARERRGAAKVARDTWNALVLATAYARAYETLKTLRGGLDFGDLIERVNALLTVRADAAWVLYKLDGGLEHVLLDEAQDTAPEQWGILRRLTDEFFVGKGAAALLRTVFAVGDEKQSIFSFQGAAPERFAAEARGFQALARQAGARFEQVALQESWRSAPEVLGFVDQVFADPEALAGLRPADAGRVVGFPVKHIARRHPGGCVEAWPLEVGDPAPDPDPWAPVDAEPAESAGRKLARRIARSVKAMILRGEAVQDRQTRQLRPCTAGDFLILVRRRNALFHEIIRALKREGVAVGGADRLLLSEHIVFADLMALARFVRFPADDLALAGLLRSPFCDIDETGLYDLAYGRAGGLWATLVARAEERSAWRAARDLLAWAIDAARLRPPFEFFSRVLSRLDETGQSMRQRMLARFGAEAEDALEAFVAEVLAAEGRDLRDLESVIAALSHTELEVKREQEDSQTRAGGEVRVMTVHGSKGLEAPIVILPDTTTRATAQGGPLLDAAKGGFLWAPRKADDCPASAEARAARDAAHDHESLRLLYVALTRARDRLIVCGVETRPHLFERSWRDYVDRAFDASDAARSFPLDGGGEGRRIGADPVLMGAARPEADQVAALPVWARRLAPPEPAALRYASPSTLGEDGGRGPAPSPLSLVDGLGRFRRGEIIHRLLQILPDLPPDQRADGAARLLARERDLSETQRAEMAAAALTVLGDARFAEVFGPGSRAEVALAGAAARLPPGLAISGRVDRLMVTPARVLVVDFKTNRPAPARIEDADRAYVVQMAVYRAVLAEVFPGRSIEAALVWTDGPRLMPVPENLMLEVLDEIVANS